MRAALPRAPRSRGLPRAGYSTNPNNKTSLCKNFEATGRCHYGHICQFAHGIHELKAKPRDMVVLPSSREANKRYYDDDNR